jgi:hypothetical protein
MDVVRIPKNTPTPLERVNKDKVLRIWSLTAFHRGKSKYKKDLPKLVLLPDINGRVIGEYGNDENEIRIWLKPHSDFKEMTKTLLHEYTHYLQYSPWYYRYQKMYEYDKNPYEIEANKSEDMWTVLLSEVSDDNWGSYLRKNKRLKRIYQRSEEMVSFGV